MNQTNEWWGSIRSDNNKLIHWLKVQWHNNNHFANAFREAISLHLEGDVEEERHILNKLATDCELNCSDINSLIVLRGFNTRISPFEKLIEFGTVNSLEEFSAALLPIMKAQQEFAGVVISDSNAPDDIRHTFNDIWKRLHYPVLVLKTLAGTALRS